jgi:hypothetical protein
MAPAPQPQPGSQHASPTATTPRQSSHSSICVAGCATGGAVVPQCAAAIACDATLGCAAPSGAIHPSAGCAAEAFAAAESDGRGPKRQPNLVLRALVLPFRWSCDGAATGDLGSGTVHPATGGAGVYLRRRLCLFPVRLVPRGGTGNGFECSSDAVDTRAPQQPRPLPERGTTRPGPSPAIAGEMARQAQNRPKTPLERPKKRIAGGEPRGPAQRGAPVWPDHRDPCEPPGSDATLSAGAPQAIHFLGRSGAFWACSGPFWACFGHVPNVA